MGDVCLRRISFSEPYNFQVLAALEKNIFKIFAFFNLQKWFYPLSINEILSEDFILSDDTYFTVLQNCLLSLTCFSFNLKKIILINFLQQRHAMILLFIKDNVIDTRVGFQKSVSQAISFPTVFLKISIYKGVLCPGTHFFAWSKPVPSINAYLEKYFKTIHTICNFKSMKGPLELTKLFLKFFYYITWFDKT